MSARCCTFSDLDSGFCVGGKGLLVSRCFGRKAGLSSYLGVRPFPRVQWSCLDVDSNLQEIWGGGRGSADPTRSVKLRNCSTFASAIFQSYGMSVLGINQSD